MQSKPSHGYSSANLLMGKSPQSTEGVLYVLAMRVDTSFALFKQIAQVPCELGNFHENAGRRNCTCVLDPALKAVRSLTWGGCPVE